MDHVAILSKRYKLLAKILSGEKTIESRWCRNRKPPFSRISIGDTVYFKESGEPVSAKAKVRQVLFFEDLTPAKIRSILTKYGKRICAGISYINIIRDKRFCTLVFLADVQPVSRFDIDKKGFGVMSAWISVEDIDSIRRIYKQKSPNQP